MPRGTVRAFITIILVAFPIGYLIAAQTPPSLVISSLFLLVAFYFEARKGGHDRINKMLKDLRKPEKTDETDQKKPLYLPKYTVRLILILLLIVVLLINMFGPQITIEATSSLIELLLIIFLFILGTFVRAIGLGREKKKIIAFVHGLPDYSSMSKYELLEKVMGRKPSWWKQKGKNILSFITLIAVIVALICYTFAIEPALLNLGFIALTLPETLLLFINVYYGLRD